MDDTKPADLAVDPAELEDPALYDHPTVPIVGSYQARIHFRRADLGEGVVNDTPLPTIAELCLFIEGGVIVGAPAFTVTVSAEHIDS